MSFTILALYLIRVLIGPVEFNYVQVRHVYFEKVEFVKLSLSQTHENQVEYQTNII